jgi:crotonobetainyl-CoA:carnitine CoA-transferase CaiB-like acyl-CoA transferase
MDAVPALGQHTKTILAELGLTDDTIARLQEQGAI